MLTVNDVRACTESTAVSQIEPQYGDWFAVRRYFRMIAGALWKARAVGREIHVFLARLQAFRFFTQCLATRRLPQNLDDGALRRVVQPHGNMNGLVSREDSLFRAARDSAIHREARARFE